MQTAGTPDEWWVTVNNKAVVGFRGTDAKERAFRYMDALVRVSARPIAADAPRSAPERPSQSAPQRRSPLSTQR